jgi:hypothetical protein
MKAQRLASPRWLPVFMVVGILVGCAGRAILPQALNKPSPAAKTSINGISVALPEGWKSLPLEPSESESGVVLHLENDVINGVTQIFKLPPLITKNGVLGYEQSVLDSAFPNHELTFGPFALRDSAMAPIVSRHKASIVLEGQRKPIAVLTAYNIAQGMTSYFVLMQAHESLVRTATTAAVKKVQEEVGAQDAQDYDWTAIGFNDFLAIVESL